MGNTKAWNITTANTLMALLQSQDMPGLEQALHTLGLKRLCEGEFLEHCRIHGEDKLVLLLCTLGVGNQVNAAQCATLLDLYQSAHRRQFEGCLARLPASHVLRQALQTYWSGKDLPLEGVPPKGSTRQFGSDEQVELAIEFLLDHGRTLCATRLISQRWGHGPVDAHKLRIARLMIARSEAPRLPDSTPGALAEAFELMHRKLGGQSNFTEVRDHVAIMMVKVLHGQQDWPSALQWAQRVVTPMSIMKSRYFQAEIHCRMRQHRLAQQCMDQTLESVLMLGVDKARSVFKAPGGNDAGAEDFNIAAARWALNDLASVLEPINHRPFLVSGTLLGYQRVGNFLSHDKDIDVGLYGHEDSFEVVDALMKSGLFTVWSKGLKLEKTYNVAVQHKKARIGIDIFFYHREDGRLVTGVQNDFGHLQKFGFTPFELQPIEFVGVKTWAPSDIDLNLRENFGNWREPDPSYISHVESPSVVDPGGEVHMLVARLQMFAAMLQRKPEKGLKLCSFMRQHAAQTMGMPAPLLERLERHFDAIKSREAPSVQPGAEELREALTALEAQG